MLDWKNVGTLVIGLVSVTLLPSTAKAEWLAYLTKMRVGVHADVDTWPSGATLDSNFENASDALQVDSGTGDVACDVTLERDSYYWFDDGGSTDIVDTQTEYPNTQTNASHAYLNIVTEINWCGASVTLDGCAWSNSGLEKPFLVNAETTEEAVGGILFAHEFGHTTGLSHDFSSSLKIMYTPFSTTSTRVTSSQCTGFRNVFPATCPSGTSGSDPRVCTPTAIWVSSFAAPPVTMFVQAPESVSEPKMPPIEELATMAIVDSAPTFVEDYYDQTDADTLVSLLSDPSYEPYQRHVLTLLGLLSDGSDAHVYAIARHAASAGANRSAAMVALGAIVSRTGNTAALDEVVAAYDQRFQRSAVLGLIVSGDRTARGILSSMMSAAAGAQVLVITGS
jgi:hypothetical protein